MTMSTPKGRENLPEVFNAYIEAVFMGSPESIANWRMDTQADKAARAKDLYENVFNETVEGL